LGAPDDGWIVGNRGTTRDPLLFRLGEPDGEWIDCTGDGLALTAIQQRTKAKCLDADGVLPQSKGDSPGSSLGIQGLRVTSVGTRVYLYGTRRAAGGSSQTALLDATIGSTTGNKTPGYPVVLHEDSKDGDERAWMQDYDPKYDPACAEDCQTASRGTLNSLSVVRDSQGNHVGWGLGSFRAQDAPSVDDSISQGVTTPLLELVADGKPFEAWEPVDDPGPAALEYLLPPSANETGGTSLIGEIVTLPGGSAVAQRDVSAGTRGPASVWRNPASGRWEALQAPFIPRGSTGLTQQANISALAPDNRGGLWLGAKSLGNETWFYRYTTKVNAAVFADVAHPIREPISASAVGGDGSYWVATLSGTVYRHDRITGWDRVSLKGWDAGVVQSPAHAIAVGEDGQGLVVGKAGRIATIGPRAVGLDLKAVLCSADKSNCATTRTLRAAAVAPGGSALAGGENRSLIWRAPGGAFQPVRPLPQTAASATITSISFPTPTRAWLATSNGEVMAGSLQGESWSWTPENLDADGSSLSRAADGAVLALNAVAVDARGHGYAVGEHGVILERTGDGARPWRRVAAGVTEHLRSLALSSDGRGALIGGDAGLILTKAGDRFGVARHSSYFDPLTTSAQNVMGGVVGVGLVPGAKAGDVEAWAATQVTAQNPSPTPPTGSILHYTNRPDEPLLGAGAGRVEPMPDTSIRQDGELDLAAFGKSDCQLASECPELTGSALANDAVARAVRDALVEDRPDLAVFTGDANDVGGSREHELAQHPLTESIMHERWSEIVADPLSRKDIPVYGALGGQDISQTQACIPPNKVECHGQHQVGLNLAWRKTFAGAAAPWGNTRDPRSHSGLTFEEVKSDHEVDTGQAALAGARTHYAVDVKRGGQRILRLVVLDTSLKTTSGTAALQNPVAEQLAWLDEVLSKEPRDEGQLSVVVSETPSYAYNNSAGATTDTLADSTAFETVLVKNKVAAVISGRLGWNGLYWVLAPGLHTPCPGGAYQEAPPGDAAQLCGASDASPQEAADGVAETLEGPLGQPVPRPSQETRKALGTFSIPVAVAASAGGKFGPDGSGSGSGSQGFWRGYTRIRLFPGRKPTEELDPVFEQRPVFDWIGVNAREHTLTPGRRMKIAGFGREPVGIDQPARYVDIDGPAITHRYNLVLADPARPHLPKIDPTSELPNHYVAVPDEVGAKIEPQTGEVTYSGRGNRPPVYALAILSVGKQAVSWPIVFAPRRSFKLAPPPRAPRVQLPPPPRPLSATPATLPPTPNTPISTPPNLQLTFPPTPQLPNLSLNTPQTQAPPPPAPPPPPVSPAASALQITPSPVGLNVAPATTVIPPPAPPIQPAPPGGARREARQRQAAAAKSEEGGDQSAGQESSGGENTQASTRLDQPRDLAFTAHAEHHQASAWSRGLLYGGGLGIAALTLALGWSLMRPGPRRRGPELPAVAWARVQRRP
jgi:hypothetical protein